MTPMMQQYEDAKSQHPGMLLLFRMGDFYETFNEDAEHISKLLGLTLTSRDKSMPMAGFPQQQLEIYLRKLLLGGHRVAVCEQVEDPAQAKGIVKRQVTRVVTPGTITEDELLDPRQPNYLLALHPEGKEKVGLAWMELSTGEFWAVDVTSDRLADELGRLRAAECLIAESAIERLTDSVRSILPATRSMRPDWTFDAQTTRDEIHRLFQIRTLAGFGFVDEQPCLTAAGGLLVYLRETLKANLGHVRRLKPFQLHRILILDEVTRRSLELTRTLRDQSREGSLLSVLDRTVTPMGVRLLHDSLLAPLTDLGEIEDRQNAVQELLHEHGLRGELRQQLDSVADLQRLTSRASTGRANPKDLAAIARSLRQLPKLKAKISSRKSSLLQQLEQQLQLCPDLRIKLDQALADDPPYNPREGGVIRDGFHPPLDELRVLAREGKSWIARYQAQEIERTGIPSLKVGFNSVHGYYIEITNAHSHKIPADYTRRQTLKNAERYITPELKQYEEKVLTAEERSLALEIDLFNQLREAVAAETLRLLATGEVLAMLDFLAGLAELASSRGYVRPKMVADTILEIEAGRHPVLEQTLPPGTFAPNDVRFGPGEGMLWLITGPNMSGKSTFIRQVALLTLLAHVGSFIPAKAATVGLTDRIFTRVGASDELSRGQSTFMVEMTEAANILNNATPKSLVILDEIGRGTSTYDGVSLAWAITEHLHDEIGCRALFATHYHELARLAETLDSLRNYHVLVQELADQVVFLHRIAPGNAERSYGIHVAKLAGIPHDVLERAQVILTDLETRQPLPGETPYKMAISPPERPRKRKDRLEEGPSLFE
jgi:DNA mismatch repair protein MutS